MTLSHHFDLKAVLKVLPFHTSAAQYAQFEGHWKGLDRMRINLEEKCCFCDHHPNANLFIKQFMCS